MKSITFINVLFDDYRKSTSGDLINAAGLNIFIYNKKKIATLSQVNNHGSYLDYNTIKSGLKNKNCNF